MPFEIQIPQWGAVGRVRPCCRVRPARVLFETDLVDPDFSWVRGQCLNKIDPDR